MMGFLLGVGTRVPALLGVYALSGLPFGVWNLSEKS